MSKGNKCTCGNGGSDIKAVGLAIIIAAFTWIIAVSWNKFLESAYDRYYPGPRGLCRSRFIYAGAITIVAVAIIYLVNAWYINNHECDGIFNSSCNDSCDKKN